MSADTRHFGVPCATAASRRALVAATVASLGTLALTGVAPADRGTWWLEVLPVVGILAVLWATRHRFPLTPLLYAGTALGLVMLCVGAHYTFERVPLGDWLQGALGLERNPYDRIGHVLQGAVPAIAARELLVRRSPLGGTHWLGPMAVVMSFAVSALYELVEWAVATTHGEDASAFLGMQGDPWDAQWDMFCALLGAAFAVAALARRHDRALARLHDPEMPRLGRVRDDRTPEESPFVEPSRESRSVEA